MSRNIVRSAATQSRGIIGLRDAIVASHGGNRTNLHLRFANPVVLSDQILTCVRSVMKGLVTNAHILHAMYVKILNISAARTVDLIRTFLFVKVVASVHVLTVDATAPKKKKQKKKKKEKMTDLSLFYGCCNIPAVLNL